MATLEEQLSQACAAIGLRIDIGHVARLGDGVEIHTVARIRDLGAPNGMLIIRDFDVVEPHLDRLDEAGYGFSTLTDPRSDESYDLEGCIEMFRDWGWAGPEEATPAWLR